MDSTLLADPAAAPRPPDATTLAAPAADSMIGKVLLGQFVVRKKLGEGGMGTVYLADQPAMGRSAVVKVLRGEMSQGRGSAARFNLEARAVSKLAHPNIVTVYNYSITEDGTLFMVMEHLDGQSLQDVITADAPLPVDRALRIARQIAAALAEAHRHGVIHRDLKPSNVMVVELAGAGELVKVLDFGVAKMDGVDLTMTGFLCGTPPYMSPEQFREGDLDGRSDLYSLAVVLFEMLTGRLPFLADSPIRYMQKHLNEAPPKPSSVRKGLDIPRPLERELLRALEKLPQDRPRSVEQFITELDEAIASPQEAAVNEAPLVLVPSPTAATAVAVRPELPLETRDRPLARRRPVWLSNAWASLSAALVASATWLWSRTGARLRRRRQPAWSRALDTVALRLGLRRRVTLRERLRRLGDRLRRRPKGWRRWFGR